MNGCQKNISEVSTFKDREVIANIDCTSKAPRHPIVARPMAVTVLFDKLDHEYDVNLVKIKMKANAEQNRIPNKLKTKTEYK